MAFDQKELEEQLIQAGNKLADPPSSVDELLSLLNRLESYLAKVEQAPRTSMRTALAPCMKELVGDKLLRHPDPDVKAALAACISEITRISAPDTPYDDDQMKEIFQLIVSSFENLDDKLSRSYENRRIVLETVAKVRSCVVMLDLDCDALILEMFQHFLKTIRDHHPKDVFSSMETIMTLVLEESEDISFDLLSPLLESIKKNNEEVFPIARKLGERVLESCGSKLKPCLVQAVRTLGISLDDYSEVLGSIFQEEAKAIKEAAQSPKDNRNGNRNSKSVTNDGVACVGEDEEFNDLDGRKVEQKPEEATKKSRRKPSHSTKSAKPSEKMIDSGSHRKKVLSSSHEDQEVAYAVTSRRAYNVESQVMASPSPSDSLPDENHSEKLCKAETKDSPSNVEVAEAVSKKVSEGASISKAKPVKQPVRKVLGQNSGVKKTAGTDSGKKQSGSASGADAKKHSVKKLDDNEGGGGSSSRQLVDKKKRGQEEMVSSPRSDIKSSEDEKLEETTMTNGKRKHASGSKNESDIMEHDQNLVGVRLEVWWPKDRQFYKGVIESFDSRKKKHKVVYDDGEVEVLNLAREKWNVIEADSDADEEEGSDRGSLDASIEMPARKKTKPSSDEPTKQGMPGLSSSGGASGSSKSKGVLKFGQKSTGGYKSNESKTVSDSEDEVSRKFKDSTPKSGSSKSATQTMTGKSKNIGGSKTSKRKDDDTIMPKPSVKSKQETPKSGITKQKTPKTAASEGKPPKGVEKSTVDSGGKGKSNSLKKKDLEDDDSESDVSASEEVEDTKGKTSGDAMNGKKRQRS